MKNRLDDFFKNRKEPALSVFYTAGFPSRNDTVVIAESLAAAGADMIEIGIPFSDPVADGPTIQQSNKVALENGMTVSLMLTQLKQIRKTVEIPIILMGYFNPVMQYGVENFAKDAAEAGADGVILPDLPLYEYEAQFKDVFEANKLKHTFLISPTTSDERIRKIDGLSGGFIYAVSASSITGARNGFSPEQLSYFARLRKMKLKNPFLIGFGISNKETFRQAGEYGAGAIVGSAFISLISNSTNIGADVKAFVSSIKS
jgi:tryptophan synthase alpha chain